MSVTLAVDAIGANVNAIPRGMQACGYTTGTGPVPWTQAQWDAHPGAVRICQDPGATDKTADVLDVETGAATTGDCPGWARAALGSYQSGARPGQRTPAVYMSASQVTPGGNALTAGGVKSGVSLWVANWNLTEPQAAADVVSAAGPFPVIGVQYHSGAALDYDAFSTAWLQAVSRKPAAHPAAGTWQEWDTAGLDSLAGLAAKLGTGPATLLTDSIQKYGWLGDPMGNYIKGIFEGTVKPTDPMPAGVRLWVNA